MSTRIGILAKNDPRHGLWRDAECLLWALQHEPVRRSGRHPAAVSLFAISDYDVLERHTSRVCATHVPVACPAVVAPGTPFPDWLRQLDIVIVCEKLLPRVFAWARQQGVRVVYIPNLDWTSLNSSVERWVREVCKSGCEVWAKTPQVAMALNAARVTCILVPWSIPDPVCRDRGVRHDGTMTFLMNAGMGGWGNRRGVDIALKAFALTQRKIADVRLIVKSIKSLASYIPREILQLTGVEVIEGMLNREDLMALHQRADAVLYPSRWEGFGLSLLEALHAGIPVIASDGWPMNELVEHGHNGLLAPAQRVGMMRLAPHWQCSPEALAQEMIRLATDWDLRRRLTCPEPSELITRQQRFILRVRELLLHEPMPRVVLFRPRSNPTWRRSEEYWADALRLHGYTVEQGFFESAPHQLQELLDEPHDFVLVGKAPPAFLAAIDALTDRPLVLWHHDLSSLRRGWVQAAGTLVDLLCVPESGLRQRIAGIRAPVLMLLPGAKVDGDRGPGRRPIAGAAPDSGPDIVFLHTWADRITQLLVALRDLPVTRNAYTLRTAASMWEQRARRLGPRSVGHIRWTEEQFQTETTTWWERLVPHMLSRRQVTDQAVLDFGCGTGRFARRLAELSFRVVGVDTSTEMVNMATARQTPHVRVVHIQPGAPLPFAPGEFDVLWVCTVLQHIPDDAFPDIVHELHRVVRRDGLLLLCENTDQTKGRTSRSGHVVFRRHEEYLAFFPGIAVVNDFVVEGESHTVFAGRLSTPSDPTTALALL